MRTTKKNLWTTGFVCLLACLLSQAWAMAPQDTSRELDCRWTGQVFVPQFLPTGLLVGRPGFGFLYPKDCYSSTLSSREGFLCQYLGANNFGIFDQRSNRFLGQASQGPASFSQCLELVLNAGSKQVCMPAGFGLLPVGPWGKQNFPGQTTFQNHQSCFTSLRMASEHFFCYQTIDQKILLGYLPAQNRVGGATSYVDFEQCYEASIASSNTRSCVPVTDGFALYQMPQNQKVETFPSLSECNQAIMEE